MNAQTPKPEGRRLGTYEVRGLVDGKLYGSFTCTDVPGSPQTAAGAARARQKSLGMACIINFVPAKGGDE